MCRSLLPCRCVGCTQTVVSRRLRPQRGHKVVLLMINSVWVQLTYRSTSIVASHYKHPSNFPPCIVASLFVQCHLTALQDRSSFCSSLFLCFIPLFRQPLPTQEMLQLNPLQLAMYCGTVKPSYFAVWQFCICKFVFAAFFFICSFKHHWQYISNFSLSNNI